MQRMHVFKMLATASLVLILWATAVGASSFELQIQGGKLNVRAENVPLQEILYRLSGYGIKVRIDPSINPSTSASFQNKDLEDGLKSILRPLNSVFIWKPENDPSGLPRVQSYRLDEIQVFKPGAKDRMIYLDQDADEATAQIPREDDVDDAESETPVVIKANRVFVPVVVSYGDKKVATSLVFDTGAGSIVLHQDVADSLGILDFEPAKGHGVGGIEIDAKVARLRSVKVGPFEKRNVRVAIVQYQGEPDDSYHGLLGMNFLRGLKYEIDFDHQVIKWGRQNTALP